MVRLPLLLSLPLAKRGCSGSWPERTSRRRPSRRKSTTLRGLSDRPFGVNLFVPGEPTADRAAIDAYVSSLAPEAQTLGTQLGLPEWDDDHWCEKVDLLVREPVPAVTFTFGCPTAEVVHALQSAGSAVGVTVTAADDVELATTAGADFLVAQGFEAGGHRATFRNDDKAMAGVALSELLHSLTGVDVPVLATGGIMDGAGVAAALHDGAIAVLCGTAFLRCPESGANRPHKDALADPRYTTTAVTRAFSGRPARGLLNGFMAKHADAPAGYPKSTMQPGSCGPRRLRMPIPTVCTFGPARGSAKRRSSRPARLRLG